MGSREARISGSEAGRARVTAALLAGPPAPPPRELAPRHRAAHTAVAAPPSAATGSAGEYAGGRGPGLSRPRALPVTATSTGLSLCLTLVLFSH